MAIEADDIARVRAATDIVTVIGEHAEIKRVGRQWMARCPMHGERTPSLSVSSEKGVYYCFGCQRSGDVITFIREMENLDFVGAVERLANRAGIEIRYTSHVEKAFHKRRRTLLDAVARARDFYHRRLMHEADAGPARAYLRSRGYEGGIVRRYRVGWAPDGWDLLARHLSLTTPDLRASGLGIKNKRDAQQDFFRARLMFPISDERGDPVAFGGRLLPGAEGPKYVNTSSASVVYDKSRVLYGLHEHRAEIVRMGQAVICEGYTDVIGSAAAGVDTAVATCGTALTEQHVELLKRFSADRLVLAFDADAAGRAAAGRVYEWERKHDIEVFVADLPDGVDPDDLARSDPDGLRRAVGDAVPFLRFRVDRVLAGHHMDTAENRARSAAAAAAVVVEHPDPMVRDSYLMGIADRCRVEIGLLRREADRAARGTRRDRGSTRPSGGRPGGGAWRDGESAGSPVEDEALRWMIHRPEEAVGWLHCSLFRDPVRREAFDAFMSAGSVIGAGEIASESAARLIHRLATDPGDAPAADVLAGVARVAVPRVMDELRRQANTAADASLRRDCIRGFTWLKEQSVLLAESETRETALGMLIPWLIEHGRRYEGDGDGGAPDAGRFVGAVSETAADAGGVEELAGYADADGVEELAGYEDADADAYSASLAASGF